MLNEDVTETLRYSVIVFLRNFSDEGIDAILQAESINQNKNQLRLLFFEFCLLVFSFIKGNFEKAKM